ncbi:uncharacterized protein V6R79_017043 [Siganus canaliculatus]
MSTKESPFKHKLWTKLISSAAQSNVCETNKDIETKGVLTYRNEKHPRLHTTQFTPFIDCQLLRLVLLKITVALNGGPELPPLSNTSTLAGETHSFSLNQRKQSRATQSIINQRALMENIRIQASRPQFPLSLSKPFSWKVAFDNSQSKRLNFELSIKVQASAVTNISQQQQVFDLPRLQWNLCTTTAATVNSGWLQTYFNDALK